MSSDYLNSKSLSELKTLKQEIEYIIECKQIDEEYPSLKPCEKTDLIFTYPTNLYIYNKVLSDPKINPKSENYPLYITLADLDKLKFRQFVRDSGVESLVAFIDGLVNKYTTPRSCKCDDECNVCEFRRTTYRSMFNCLGWVLIGENRIKELKKLFTSFQGNFGRMLGFNLWMQCLTKGLTLIYTKVSIEFWKKFYGECVYDDVKKYLIRNKAKVVDLKRVLGYMKVGYKGVRKRDDLIDLVVGVLD